MSLLTLALFLSYLAGSIPFGLICGRIAGIDVRVGGSGNIGATNVNRLAGKKLGALTLFADIMKGFLPPVAATALMSDTMAPWLPAACGLAAFLGHLFPVWLGFKGGKGVATALGVFFFVSPVATAVCLAVFVIVVACFRYVSLGSILSSAAMPLILFALQAPKEQLYLATAIALFVWLKHRTNIVRLLLGKESRLGQSA